MPRCSRKPENPSRRETTPGKEGTSLSLSLSLSLYLRMHQPTWRKSIHSREMGLVDLAKTPPQSNWMWWK